MWLTARRLVAFGCLGPFILALFLVVAERTAPPALPGTITIMLIVLVLVLGPWLVLIRRRLAADPTADRLFRRVIAIGAALIAAGTVTSALLTSSDEQAPAVAMFSVLVAGVLALVGGVVFPWLFLLTRTLTRERAARIRAEERAQVAAHLHDSVLQALTLMQKQADNPAVLRLARSTERELRAWLYGAPTPGSDDLAAAVRAVVEEVEDRFAVHIELITVGTGRLDDHARALVGAIREALTNAAQHAGVRHVSVFAEVTDDEQFALVRDRGRGFDPGVHNGTDRRGIADSIEGRMRQHGGTAIIRSTPGQGTEVELRMPVLATARRGEP